MAISATILAGALFVVRSVWNESLAYLWLIPLALGAAAWWLARRSKRLSATIAIVSLAISGWLAFDVVAESGLLSRPDYEGLAEMNASEFQTITPDGWTAIVKNPIAAEGKKIIVYSDINQFDQATGEDTFLGDASALQPAEESEYDSNTLFRGDPKLLKELGDDDIVRVHGVVTGSYSYENTMGGGTDAVQVDVARIEKVGLYDLRKDVEIIKRRTVDEYESVVELKVTNSAGARREYSVTIAAKSKDGGKDLGEATASTSKLEPGETVEVDAGSLYSDDVPEDAKLVIDDVTRY